MAFLGLFKKKAKKVEEGFIPKLGPVSKPEESIELPKPPEIPKPRIGVPDIPPISAPKTSQFSKLSDIGEITKLTPSNYIPPIKLPETNKMPESIKPMQEKPSNVVGIPLKENKSPFMAHPEEKETKHFEALNKKEDGIKDSVKEELPSFSDVNIKKMKIERGVEIPAPPHYFSHIENAREGVAEEERMVYKGLRKPIFIEVNDYRKVIEEINAIKKDSKKSKELVRALGDFKVKNSVKIKNWEKGLEKIQRDLVFIDKILFEEDGGNK